MKFIIDGHNLIGSGIFEDIRLDDENDEAKLILRLQALKPASTGEITVVFDHGIVEGRSKELSRHGIKVIFARYPREADDIIIHRIRSRESNLTVVSNDRVLHREAKEAGVEVWSSDQFLNHLTRAKQKPSGTSEDPGEAADVHLSQDELDEWMELFRNQHNESPLNGGKQVDDQNDMPLDPNADN